MSDTPRETRSQDSDDARNDAVGDNPPDTSSADQTSDVTDRDVADRPADTAESTDRPATTDGTDRTDTGAANETTTGTAPDADRTASQDDATQVMAPVDDQGRESRRVTRDELYARDDRRGEQERLAAVRADHEAANAPAAEPVPAPAAEEPTGRRKRLKYPRTTDRFFPSLGLLLLRLTLAAVFGVHGVQKLLTMEQTSQFFESLSLFGMPLPYPSVLALATGVAEVMIAVSLAFGFLVRFASVGVLLITIGALLMVKMTALPNPLEPGASGISGELELVLAGAGALLLCVGGGAWALDRLFRRGRYSKDPQDLVA